MRVHSESGCRFLQEKKSIGTLHVHAEVQQLLPIATVRRPIFFTLHQELKISGTEGMVLWSKFPKGPSTSSVDATQSWRLHVLLLLQGPLSSHVTMRRNKSLGSKHLLNANDRVDLHFDSWLLCRLTILLDPAIKLVIAIGRRFTHKP